MEPKRKLHFVILHCAVTPDAVAPPQKGWALGAREIDGWHRERGWSGIGYHYVIKRDGELETGRPLDKVGAHAVGANGDSIGVCLMGTREFTDAQYDTLGRLFIDLWVEHRITYKNWLCHYEVSESKTCPNLPAGLVRAWLRGVRDRSIAGQDDC